VPPFAASVLLVAAMLPLPLAAWQLPPLDAAQVQVQDDNVPGNVSATETAETALVDGFVAVIV
jgi:hypothetical protein